MTISYVVTNVIYLLISYFSLLFSSCFPFCFQTSSFHVVVVVVELPQAPEDDPQKR